MPSVTWRSILAIGAVASAFGILGVPNTLDSAGKLVQIKVEQWSRPDLKGSAPNFSIRCGPVESHAEVKTLQNACDPGSIAASLQLQITKGDLIERRVKALRAQLTLFGANKREVAYRLDHTRIVEHTSENAREHAVATFWKDDWVIPQGTGITEGRELWFSSNAGITRYREFRKDMFFNDQKWVAAKIEVFADVHQADESIYLFACQNSFEESAIAVRKLNPVRQRQIPVWCQNSDEPDELAYGREEYRVIGSGAQSCDTGWTTGTPKCKIARVQTGAFCVDNMGYDDSGNCRFSQPTYTTFYAYAETWSNGLRGSVTGESGFYGTTGAFCEADWKMQ